MRFDAEYAPQGEGANVKTRPVVCVEPQLVTVAFSGETIAMSNCALRVRFSGEQPLFLLPKGDVRTELLQDAGAVRSCDLFGQARCWSIVVGDRVADQAAWSLDAACDVDQCAERRFVERIAFDPASVVVATAASARPDSATDYTLMS